MTTEGDRLARASSAPEQAPESLESARHPRGPLRPSTLRTVRVRRARRLASHTFYGVDAVAVAVLTIGTVLWTAGGSLLDATVAQAGPFVVGAVLLPYLLASSGAYLLVRCQRWAYQVAQVMAVAFVGGLVVLGLATVLRSPEPAVRGALWWTVLAAIGLAALHTLWFVLVRRWRRLHWLTPNIVLVGATAHAEQLINEAIARRHINVLGIFDDRLNRVAADRARGSGARRHRGAADPPHPPYLDLIVITVDPSATTRVREIMARLAPLPNAVHAGRPGRGDREGGRASRTWPTRRWPRSGGRSTPTARPSPSGSRTWSSAIPMLVLVSPLLALVALAVQAGQPRAGLLPPAPARVQQRGDRGVEVPHDAPRVRRQPGRTAGDARTTTGSPGSGGSCARPAWTSCRSCST